MSKSHTYTKKDKKREIEKENPHIQFSGQLELTTK